MSRGPARSGCLRVDGHKQLYSHAPPSPTSQTSPSASLGPCPPDLLSYLPTACPEVVGMRKEGRIICPQLQAIQTSSDKWKTVDHNESSKFSWRYTCILRTRLFQDITHHLLANASGLHLLPMITTKDGGVVHAQ